MTNTLGAQVQQRIAQELTELPSARGARLTEAENMCATVLSAYPSSEWESVLARIVMEPRAITTAQNVMFSMPTLLAGGFQRVLAISTPTYRPYGIVENHASRAAAAFRAYRPASATYRVGAIACPFGRGGPTVAEFESAARSTRAVAHVE
jgi:hypothetical protein